MIGRMFVGALFVISFCASPILASGGVENTEEDEAKAFATRASFSATEFGTAAEAKAMLERAIAALKTSETAAITAFNRNDAQFRDRDLFVFCFNGSDGTLTAHEALVGQNVRTLRDGQGTSFGEQMYLIAKEGQIEVVKYMSPTAGSTDQASKRALVARVGNHVCGVSFYRFNGPGAQPIE